MNDSDNTVKIEYAQGAHVISIVGSLIDRICVERISSRIIQEVQHAAERPKVVICFDQIKEVSSSILGVVIQIEKQIRQKQGQLKLSGMQPNVKEVFHLTRLDSILDIYETSESAMDSFDD